MLANSNDLRNHEELIVERGNHCAHLESGNPFLSDQELIYSTNKEKVSNYHCGKILNSDSDSDISNFYINENLKQSLLRLKKYPNNPHIANMVGLNYLRKGNIREAIDIYTKTLTTNPGFFQAKANLANCYSSKGEIEKALSVYKELEQINNNDERVLTNIAILEFQRGEQEKSLEYLKKANKVNPNNASVLNNIGIMYLKANDASKAISNIRKAYNLKNDDPIIINNLGVSFVAKGDLKKAINCFKIAYNLKKKDRGILVNLSKALQVVGDHNEVIGLTTEYIKENFNEVELRNIKSWSLFKTEQYEKCLKQLQEALERTPDDDKKNAASLLNNIGVVNEHLGFSEKAEDYFESSLKLFPEGNVSIFCNVIHFYLIKDDLVKAKEKIDLAISLYDKELQFKSYLGEYYFKVKEYNKSKEILYSVMESNPKLLLPYATLSTILSDIEEDTDKALEIIEQGYNFNKDSIKILNNYAYILLLAGKTKQARVILEKINQVDDVYILATRGLLLIKEENIKEGRAYYNRAKSIAGKNKNLSNLVEQKKNLELAKYYIQHNNINEARRLLQIGMGLKTQETYIKSQLSRLLVQCP